MQCNVKGSRILLNRHTSISANEKHSLANPLSLNSDMPQKIIPQISLQTASCRCSSSRGPRIVAGRHHQTSTIDRQRTISTYGYTQAKSLVYGKHGNPSEVLRYVDTSVSA